MVLTPCKRAEMPLSSPLSFGTQENVLIWLISKITILLGKPLRKTL
jgi:hypothetical protein